MGGAGQTEAAAPSTPGLKGPRSPQATALNGASDRPLVAALEAEPPTLDINLGKEIELLKGLGIKAAVISNASLIWKEEVRDDLNRSDWVSLKIDAVSEDIWRRIDRAHGLLRLEKIL